MTKSKCIKPQRVQIEKEPVKTLYLRIPNSFYSDIQKIMSLTGLSMNAVCLELIRPAIKRKLKELAEE